MILFFAMVLTADCGTINGVLDQPSINLMYLVATIPFLCHGCLSDKQKEEILNYRKP